jgi:predicted enzyme related to lactoylglutathione lyase
MGKRTSYRPGTFSWVDLATSDPNAARSFYSGLFGWEPDDGDAADGVTYTTCRLGGEAVCGIFAMPEEMRDAGAPSRWNSYVTVADADAAAARAVELGGEVVQEPIDVLDAGRMAILADTQGAALAVWQPRARIGAERVNDPGCLCMNELATGEYGPARDFYAAMFGWTMETIEPSGEAPELVFVHNEGTMNASFVPIEGGARPYWRPVFTVASTEAAAGRVRELGGTVVLEPLEFSDGSIATALDPLGAEFSLFEGEVDP